MAEIQWDERFSVGVAAIDEQHKKLLYMINDLDQIIAAGRSGNMVLDIVNRMRDYAAEHFSYEEEYFERFGFPEAEAHVGEHREFEAKVAEYIRRPITDADHKTPRQMYLFLRDWLLHHIQHVDKRYGPFFNEHGLQ